MFLALFWLCLVTDPNQAAVLLQQGLIALKQAQFVQARSALEEASRLDPHNAYVWASLAETYLHLKQPQQASAAAEAAENAGAANPIVSHALAMFYSESSDPARAFAFAQRAEKQNASAANRNLLADTAFEYAQVLMRQQSFTRASYVVQSALTANPENPQLTLALGVARYGQRRFEDSVVEFLKVIQIDPSIEQPYVFLGRMLEQAGTHLDEITRAYEVWAAKHPENAIAQLLLAKALLAKDGRDPRPETLLRRSIALDGLDWESHYELGVLLESKHDYQASADELALSIKLDSKQPMPHYHLARVYQRLGQPERARAERETHQRLTLSNPASDADPEAGPKRE